MVFLVGVCVVVVEFVMCRIVELVVVDDVDDCFVGVVVFVFVVVVVSFWL